MHDAIMAEFGGSLVGENTEAEASREEMEHDMSSGTAVYGIQLRPQGAEITEA